MSSNHNHSLDHFTKCFESAFAKVKQRQIRATTDQSKHGNQGVAQVVNQTTTIVTKPVVTQRLSDEDYKVALLSKMKSHLANKQHINDDK